MKNHYLLLALLLAGCAQSDQPVAPASDPAPLPQRVGSPDTASVRTPEQLKAYPVGRYADPDDPEVMHEAHTVYRAESAPEWNTAPSVPTYVPLGPTMATANPSQQHTALTAELEQRVNEENQLLQTTYEQNERLAQEIQALQDQAPRIRSLPEPTPQPATAASESKPPAASPSPAPSVNPPPSSQQKSWWAWMVPQPQPTPNKN